jgi:acetyl-CoA carboxylase biotin carboxyl carrier protein
MRIEEVRRLIRLVEESEIGELEVWKWWGRIRIRKEASGNGSAVHVIGGGDYVPRTAPPPPVPAAEAAAAAASEPARPAEEEKGITVVKSPMVGTFYRAPAPDAEPYVQPGDSVEPGQTICIIEAMKLMNEIQSEVRGRIVKILVDNAHAVEFGQELFHVKTD